jgi:sulfite oxidase
MGKRESDAATLGRRQFAKLIGVTGLGLGFAPNLSRFAFAAETVDASMIVKGKVPEMIVHNAKLGVMETPLGLLRQHDVTPKQILFNRLHFPVSGDRAWTATTEPPHFKEWNIDVSGLVERPRTLSLAELKQIDSVKVTSVMQCAGNGRSYYSAKAKVPGGQWMHGGMGNVQWEGPPLREVLAYLDLGPSPNVRWLTANGRDNPPTKKGVDFVKSYHIDDPALEHAVLALKMNGEPIPAVHGGPVRLIVPGFYGNMNVKYLTQLLFENEQSPSPFQSKAYRVPIMEVQPGQMTVADFSWGNSVPTYGFRIMSVIFSPLAEDAVRVGPVTVSGVAWNDGTAPITEVGVSTDGGGSWRAAAIDTPDSPFAWYRWRAQVALGKGEHEVMVRATDAQGRTQPMNGNARWNPKGYEWNGVDRVKVTVS